MTSEQVNRISIACNDFGVNFMRAREAARNAETLTWEVSPKVHKMQHMPLLCSVMNPKFVCVYEEESCVGTTTKIWAASKHGRYKRTVQATVLRKKLLGVLLRFEE